jgi:putative restriction endonuclease
MQEFPTPVPRDYLGQPLERWLRETLPEHRNVLSSGASVRDLAEEEGQLILELGHAGQLGIGDYQDTAKEPETLAAERSRRVVEAVERDARFRRNVMSAYDYRCAVTGLEIGSLPEGRATRLLDAAHIRPVGDRGPDVVTNGISLTPTVHRLFDEGLVTGRWIGPELRLVRSPRLELVMIESAERGTKIRIEDEMQVLLPKDPASWPSTEQIRYHQLHVFKGPESLLT